MKSTTLAIAVGVVVIVVALASGYIGFSMKGYTTVTSTTTVVHSYTTTTSVTNTSAGIGIVSGLVNTGSLNIANLSSYRLVFHSTTGQDVLVPIYPTSHFATSLPVGTYTITGFSPGCNWAGCNTGFPMTVVVQFGMQVTIEIQASN